MAKKYNIIYADPPWSYANKGTRAAADKHYVTMSLDAIKSLPLFSGAQNIAADNSALFLWVTAPMLPFVFDIIKAWGFTYKTVAFVWVKQNKKNTSSLFWGLGNYTRSNAEFCLLATKGNIKRAAKDVHSVIMSPIAEHSKKPGETRNRIVKLMGDLPRIELFARETAPGWDAWGNEIL